MKVRIGLLLVVCMLAAAAVLAARTQPRTEEFPKSVPLLIQGSSFNEVPAEKSETVDSDRADLAGVEQNEVAAPVLTAVEDELPTPAATPAPLQPDAPVSALAPPVTISSAVTTPPQAPSMKSGALVVSFGVLSNFEYSWASEDESEGDALAKLPESVRRLNGRTIEIEGFMMPMNVSGAGLVTNFILVPSQLLCCYGVPPEINEWIEVTVSGKGVPAYTDVPIRIRGRFFIGENIIDDVMVGLYRMTADSVEEAE